MKSNFYVYEHWRLDRDECFYVGKGHGNRAYDMRRGRNRHHKAIVAKMHRIGSSVEVRIVADGLVEAEAFRIERERIKFWKDAGADLANLTDGGGGTAGFKMSEETKAKLAEISRNMSQEHRNKIAAAARNISDETRAKMAESKRNMSKEQREKIAEMQRNMSSEQRGKRAEKARNMPDTQKAKIAEKVRMYNASMTPQQRAAKAEKGRINAMKRWNKTTEEVQ